MTPENAIKNYPNLFAMGEDGVLEIYADNHILSSYRKCPGYFVESIMNRRGTKGRQWSLEFGQYFHKIMEYFYKAQKEEWKGIFCEVVPKIEGAILLENCPEQNLQNLLALVNIYWYMYDLDAFKDHPSCKKLGGLIGATNLFLQYYLQHYQVERLRVVGTELSFGRAKEVPIHDDNTWCLLDGDCVRVRMYYCGRIDLVVDDGTIIGPMDHKTTSYFDGSEGSEFKPHDGMQGYVYAFQRMLPENLRAQGRTCNSIYINHVSIKTEEKDGRGRFKHSIKSYTPAEMEEWRLRQVRTFTDIYRHIILEEPIYWNTEACGRWFGFSDCPYKQLHEAAPLSREAIAKSNYVTIEAWSHERV